MRGIQIITDENHEKFEQEVFTAPNLNGANTLKIGSEAVCKDFMGFGVAITGSSCYNLSIMDKEKRDELINKVYSKDGLNLSVARLSIGSSDYSAELYSYDDVPFDEKLEHFSIDKDRAYVINGIVRGQIKVDLCEALGQMTPKERIIVLKYVKDGKLECKAESLTDVLTPTERKFLTNI